MQIKNTLTNKRKMHKENLKEEKEEISLTRNTEDNDQYSLEYQPE
jgi:hypothetical protein